MITARAVSISAAIPLLLAILSGLLHLRPWFPHPPPPKLHVSPAGPPTTSPRIQLRDGRYLSYRESGVPRTKAKHKIIHIHGFDSSKDFELLPVSRELVEEMAIYFVAHDRAGYGESDANLKKSVKSEAMDVFELAEKLKLDKVYILGVSMGALPVWGCLHYFPKRFEGSALVVPAVSYWWPSFPKELTRLTFSRLAARDQLTFLIARHVPSLLYAWLTQTWIPSLSIIQSRQSPMYAPQDLEILVNETTKKQQEDLRKKARQQGVFYSLHQDLKVLFGRWDFDPMEMDKPTLHGTTNDGGASAAGDGAVHLWQGYHDRFVPVELVRHLAGKLTWIDYHENPDGGHLFVSVPPWPDKIVTTLLRRPTPPPAAAKHDYAQLI